MNFLAHIYLSGLNQEVIFGNFIGDFVRGKQVESFSENIRKGIELHRFIDQYTDTHPVVLEQKTALRSYFRKYAGVALDVYYDYFLAVNWNHFHHQSLRDYTHEFYELASLKKELLPEKGKRFYNFMIANDVLYQYRTQKGIGQVFVGMSQRSKFDSGMENAHRVLHNNFNTIESSFQRFFPELKKAAKDFRTGPLNLSQ